MTYITVARRKMHLNIAIACSRGASAGLEYAAIPANRQHPILVRINFLSQCS